MLNVVSERLGEGESKWDYRKRIKVERKQRIDEKRLHDKFFRDVKDVADKRSWQ